MTIMKDDGRSAADHCDDEIDIRRQSTGEQVAPDDSSTLRFTVVAWNALFVVIYIFLLFNAIRNLLPTTQFEWTKFVQSFWFWLLSIPLLIPLAGLLGAVLKSRFLVSVAKYGYFTLSFGAARRGPHQDNEYTMTTTGLGLLLYPVYHKHRLLLEHLSVNEQPDYAAVPVDDYSE